jgi:D-aminopeptidase
MICHELKGGIGTSSRVVGVGGVSYTVGALVQANYGSRRDLRVDGVALGRRIGYDVTPAPWPQTKRTGSIIVVLATDAPLIPTQCRRLARRATVGLARAGGVGHNSSGDIFLAFSTHNHVPLGCASEVTMLPHSALDPLFEAAADATEESIVNALCAAETMTGRLGRTAHALPHANLSEAMRTRP